MGTKYLLTSSTTREYTIFYTSLRLPNREHSNGLNMRPNPFKCRITPRNAEIRATIDREGEEALQRLAIYNGETKYRFSDWYPKK